MIKAIENPSQISSPRHLARRVMSAVAVVILAASTALAADPFYENLLRKGTDQFNRRDFAAAARTLRVACFGFLDEPTLLADALTRLGLAQAAAGNDEGFRETFRRVEEVESRFQAYTQATIAADVRKAFEGQVVRLVPEATLAANPTFARLVPKPEDRVAQLPPKQRRKELERLIKTEPTKAVWFVMLASLDAADGEMKDSREHADAALRLEPANKDALRLRGLAEANAQQWVGAQHDLAASGAALADPQVAEALLLSLVELKRFDDAESLAATLSPDVARDRRVQEARRRVTEGKKAAAAAVPTPTGATTALTGEATASGRATDAKGAAVAPVATPSPTTAPPRIGRTATPAATPTKPAPTPAREAIRTVLSDAARKDLAKAATLADENRLAEAFLLAKQVADANPGSREAQHAAAEMAYRSARWNDALAYFQRGGDPGDSEPLRLFYLAVTQYETGHRNEAKKTLARCISKVKRTDYVEQYVNKITGMSSKTSTETP